MNTDPKPSTVIAQGRPVMRAHPELSTAAAELLHTLDELPDEDRLHARRYLLHVYGVTVGLTPTAGRLEDTETWAQDRNALASASGHMLALAGILEDSFRDEVAHEDEALFELTHAHATSLLEVAHRG